MGTERCNFCATTKDIKDLKRCSNCRQVNSSSFQSLLYLIPYFVTTGSPSTASVSPITPFSNTNPNPLRAVQGVPKTTLEDGPQSRLRARSRTTEPQGISRRKGAAEESRSVDQRLVSRDVCVFAYRSGPGEPRMGSPPNTRVRSPPSVYGLFLI
jgi:rubredoxin